MNVKRKRVPGGGSSYSKTTRTEAWADMFEVFLPMVAQTRQLTTVQLLNGC